MSLIELHNANVSFPIRKRTVVTLKEFIVKGLFRSHFDKKNSVHAIKDVSLKVEDGERVGIIGYNGAGKSSLLRTVGGIYPIESGTYRVDGSVCGLFEITCGFELEGTGWDNIYYRSYLQGETPKTVKDKLPEIADFCELGDFLDLPVRCYSSGTLMRLAFAIATSSEPDILLIDEVFSTGDAAFQQKAKERMQNFMHRANIVVMVAHDLTLIEQFCTRVIWLNQGQIHMDGPPETVLELYKSNIETRQAA